MKKLHTAAKIKIHLGATHSGVLQKSIAISIAILFPPSTAIAIAILYASIANNHATCTVCYCAHSTRGANYCVRNYCHQLEQY